jgi:hypothetical protein
MATITARNGVNVDQLMATIGAVQQDPNVAAFTFKASSTWRSGARNDGEIKDFVHAGQPAVRPEAFHLAGDEPPVLLGSNEGPNAVELLLQALGFCYAVGSVYNAAARASTSPSCATRSRAILISTASWDWKVRAPGSPPFGPRAG